MGFIYLLYDTEKFLPRYVGETTRTVDERFQEHWNDALNGNRREVFRWMRERLLSGFTVRPYVVCEVPNEEIKRAEFEYIASIPNLTNMIGQTAPDWSAERTAQVMSGLSAKASDFEDNYWGYHGVRFHKTYRAFTVTVCVGTLDGPCNLKQVEGDILPGAPLDESNYIWFSNLQKALAARKAERERIEGMFGLAKNVHHHSRWYDGEDLFAIRIWGDTTGKNWPRDENWENTSGITRDDGLE